MPTQRLNDRNPLGFTLRCTLREHSASITRMAWSADGKALASPSVDKTIRLWDMQTGKSLCTLTGHLEGVNSVSWSPDGKFLVSGSNDRTVRIWNAQTGQLLRILKHSDWVRSVAWSPDGKFLASGSDDRTVRIWNAQTGKMLSRFAGHSGLVNNVSWSPDGRFLASCSDDQTIQFFDMETMRESKTLKGHDDWVFSIGWSPDSSLLASCSRDNTIRLWDSDTGRLIRILEGHTNAVSSISFSFDGRFLASKSYDSTVRIWRVDTGDAVVLLKEPFSDNWLASLTFHPQAPILVTLGERDSIIRVWDLDITTLLRTPAISSHYTNAKVVLVGDSGVGKSGLALLLTGQPFEPTESTHGRHVWSFEKRRVRLKGQRIETRETLLWDLAGQPGYRLIHQLHLNEVVVTLIVFDSHSETDPLGGIYYWARALNMAEHIQDRAAISIKKILVAARVDRGGKGVSHERINALVQELGFDGYFETSAKEGWQVRELKAAIRKAIDWETLPKVSSTALFQRIKAFLINEKEDGRLLSTYEDLYRAFLKTDKSLREMEDLTAQFSACIGRVEAQGLIRRLPFGNLVLLQPELLDAYASALINAVKDEPDGLGSILEEKVRNGVFSISKEERISDKEKEKLLLIAMIEDLLRHEIALREQGEDGPYLVFPSQSTRENPDLPDPEGRSVIFHFEGPVLNVYATLAVRLAHSGVVQKKNIWKNAVTYTAKVGGVCGISIHNIGEGQGELTLFFDRAASEETRFHFEEYVQIHLLRRSIPETIWRRRIFACPKCGELFTDSQVKNRRDRGFNWIRCNVCDSEKKIILLDREERLVVVPNSLVAEMDRSADSQVERETAKSTVQGKIETEDFDVFLCYNAEDQLQIKKIGEQLKEQGFLPWLDEWEIRPGLPWQRILQQQIGKIKSAAVFVGSDGIGPWQQEELEAFLREFVKRGCIVIPVLLPNIPKEPQLPPFLSTRMWVDFRKLTPEPMSQLIWGITGKRTIRL